MCDIDPPCIGLPSETATAAFAQALAPRLAPGDTILLEGPIGAGKTFFARTLIQARLAASGTMEEVPSPTYTLVQTYWDGATEIWHADLYRLGAPDEIVELGLDDAFDTAICLVEWPDRLAGTAPKDALTLQFAIGSDEGARTLKLSCPGAWAGRLDDICETRLAV